MPRRTALALALVAVVTSATAETSPLASIEPSEPDAGAPAGTGWWLRPIALLRGIVLAMHDSPRPYDVALRPREVAGNVAVSCERLQGRACGSGFGSLVEVDSSIGHASNLSGTWRLRVTGGTEAYAPTLALDRAHLDGRLGPIEVEVGRDSVSFGPSSRTQLGWGTNAPPLDHVRLSTSSPYRLTPAFDIEAHYMIGQLRPPQTYPRSLTTIARVKVRVADSLEIGTMQLLQLGGDGAPDLGLLDFFVEHVRRRDRSATATDSSNRRFGGDIAFGIRELAGARFYYAIMFEDVRRDRMIDAIRYDADHLFGVEVRGITFEWHQTGVRSHEHYPRTTGFTNAGFVVGAPLGPDAESFHASARLAFDAFTVRPWFELATLSSDTYQFIVDGPINRTSIGEDETRYRAGTRIRVPVRKNVLVEGDVLYERVYDFAFESGTRRNNFGSAASIIWYPQGPLGRLSLH